jgi:hypothetical protein
MKTTTTSDEDQAGRGLLFIGNTWSRLPFRRCRPCVPNLLITEYSETANALYLAQPGGH